MSHWAAVRSHGCLLYFDEPLAQTPGLATALIEEVVGRFELAKTLKISTKNRVLRWRKFKRSAVVDAVADPDTRGVTWMVGSPLDVRLGGAVELRPMPGMEKEFQAAPFAWLGAESERWPEASFLNLARRWLHLAAELGTPLSGGVLSASTLKNAKVEMTQIFESGPGDPATPDAFDTRMQQERSYRANWNKIRRVYPLTLLGPKFAAEVDVGQLAAAGAVDIERVKDSIIFATGTPMLEAWDPSYLDATRPLRRLLWPWMAQNPADQP